MNDLRYGQRFQLLEDGYAFSSQFKTNTKYGFQAVTLGDVSRDLFVKYLTKVRPKRLTGENDPLWLGSTGLQETEIGQLITCYYEHRLTLHITTTIIRSLIETEMHAGYKNGLVSQAEKEAVHNLNGHSSQIVQDYYLLEDQRENITSAGRAFDNLYFNRRGKKVTTKVPPAAVPNDDDYYCGDYDDDDDFVVPNFNDFEATPAQPAAAAEDLYNDWGLKHPERSLTSNKRVTWSNAEIDYIRNFYTKTIKANPAAEKTIVSRCLKAIQADQNARHLFHRNHTLTSARLRHGYRIFRREIQDDNDLS